MNTQLQQKEDQIQEKNSQIKQQVIELQEKAAEIDRRQREMQTLKVRSYNTLMFYYDSNSIRCLFYMCIDSVRWAAGYSAISPSTTAG